MYEHIDLITRVPSETGTSITDSQETPLLFPPKWVLFLLLFGDLPTIASTTTISVMATTALTTTISVRDRFLFGPRLLDKYGRLRSVLHKAVECNRRSLLTSTLATTTRLKASFLPPRVLYRSIPIYVPIAAVSTWLYITI